MKITAFKHRKVDPDRKVKVYRNLKHGREAPMWSIQQDGVIVAHAEELILRDVKFLINKAGQEKVRKEKRKNVHAFAVGYLAFDGYVPVGRAVSISYNPYKNDTFVFRRNIEQFPIPITAVPALRLTPIGLFGYDS